MSSTNRRFRVIATITIILAICCLGAASPNGDSSKQPHQPEREQAEDRIDEHDGFDEEESFENHEEFDDDYEDDFGIDEERELGLEIAEQEHFARSIDLAAEVAKDEVKTAIVTATLLLEHAEPTTVIKTLRKAIENAKTPAAKRALALKLAEAHLENDDPTSAVSVATELVVGE